MNSINIVAKNLSAITGMFVSFYSKNSIECLYDGPVRIGADERERFATWFLSDAIANLKDSDLLSDISIIRIRETKGINFINFIKPYDIIAGPFLLKESSRRHVIESLEDAGITGILRKIPVLSIKTLRAFAGFASAYASISMEMPRIVSDKDRMPSTEKEAMFQNRMSIDSIATRYKMERQIRKCIIMGDRNRLLSILSSADNSNLTDPDRPLSSIRQQKDYIISLNTLCRLSAEEAGLSDLQIHTISHSMHKKIDSSRSREELESIVKELAVSYCDAVAENARNTNSYVIKKVRKYLIENINSNFSLEQLADMVNVNPSYLSRLFKKECNITISQFVRNQKIREAKWMLENSSLPIVEISESLGFEYNSYFSNIFMKETGLSPSEYRRKFGRTHYDGGAPQEVTS